MRYHERVARFGSAAQAWDATPGSHEKSFAMDRAQRVCDDAARCGARILESQDEAYPPKLRELPDPPPILFAIGNLALLDATCVAIVGTRRASVSGERVTAELSSALARAGVTIVSGMARGIDGAAHRAALAATGATVGVLGTGVDVAYPASHRALHLEIRREGLLLSEELPGDRATSGSFPRRNRIIAALARATIVIEAPHKSGALITAAHAADLGRDVGAVPGAIDVPQCAGSNALLRDGAIFIGEVADALALVGLAAPGARSRAPTDSTQLAVWNALETVACDLDALASRAGLPARLCLAAVSALELEGAIECSLTGEIRRRGLS